ncbi:MAG: RsmB/NOP family class I SAM-dependent RNA methyltransferase [Pseudomonadota bacterium]
MTPGARVAAAISVLDDVVGGMPAEQALLRWARASRFAGSGDRAAIRDHVFDVLRNWRSDAVQGGGQTGRALMIGRLRAVSNDLDKLFTGQGHAPPPLSVEELAKWEKPGDMGDVWNLPDWLIPYFERSLTNQAAAAAIALQARAPITLRVNIRKTSVADGAAALSADGIKVQHNPRASTALSVLEGARRIRQSNAYIDGLVEMQDASSQAMVLGLPKANRTLDYCAGGGGKALALAAVGSTVTAHDANPGRMENLPSRAARAGTRVQIVSSADLANTDLFDLVLCDVPCSGSGAWRRTPEAKWRLMPNDLAALQRTQSQILNRAQNLVTRDGYLIYATCSVLMEENADLIDEFLNRHPDWQMTYTETWPIDETGDGFFVAHLRRAS